MKVSDGVSDLRRGLAAVLLVAVVSALLALMYAMNDPVQTVRISGDLSDAERAAVKEAVLHRLDGGLFGVSLDDVVDDVTALSWTREVRARRVWPASVEVSVAKDPIAARWGAGGVLNTAGDVIALAGTPDAALPLITCAHASGARAMRIFQMLGEVLSDTQLKIAAIEENEIAEWQVKFTNDLTVSLGHEQLLERVERFDRVYRNVIKDRVDQVERVDARYGNGVAVSWRPGANELRMASVASPTGVVR